MTQFENLIAENVTISATFKNFKLYHLSKFDN